MLRQRVDDDRRSTALRACARSSTASPVCGLAAEQRAGAPLRDAAADLETLRVEIAADIERAPNETSAARPTGQHEPASSEAHAAQVGRMARRMTPDLDEVAGFAGRRLRSARGWSSARARDRDEQRREQRARRRDDGHADLSLARMAFGGVQPNAASACGHGVRRSICARTIPPRNSRRPRRQFERAEHETVRLQHEFDAGLAHRRAPALGGTGSTMRPSAIARRWSIAEEAAVGLLDDPHRARRRQPRRTGDDRRRATHRSSARTKPGYAAEHRHAKKPRRSSPFNRTRLDGAAQARLRVATRVYRQPSKSSRQTEDAIGLVAARPATRITTSASDVAAFFRTTRAVSR